MKFKKGNRIKIVGSLGSTGVIYDITADNRYVIISDADGQLYNFTEQELMFDEASPRFKVGDKVTFLNRALSPGYADVFKIVKILNDEYCVSTETTGWNEYEFIIPFQRANEMFCLVESECQHDWKIFRGFRFDDEYCTKCQAKRAIAS